VSAGVDENQGHSGTESMSRLGLGEERKQCP
jgi:hypothetical protein